jgi:hypothetical protein
MGGGFIAHGFIYSIISTNGILNILYNKYTIYVHVRCRKIYNLETGSFFWCVSQRVQINYIYICIPTVQVYCVNPAMCDKIWHWLAAGRGFSPGTLVSSTNETGGQDITEILLKVALNTIDQTDIIKLFWYMIHVEGQ